MDTADDDSTTIGFRGRIATFLSDQHSLLIRRALIALGVLLLGLIVANSAWDVWSLMSGRGFAPITPWIVQNGRTGGVDRLHDLSLAVFISRGAV